jgi:type II secretory pathway component PulK
MKKTTRLHWRNHRVDRREGFILIVVLMMVVLLGVLGASYAFSSNAQMSASQAYANQVQARLAAEAGIQRAILLLRDPEVRAEVDQWFNSPETFDGDVVWSTDEAAASLSDGGEVAIGEKTWRFSVVGDDPNDDDRGIRYGMTDEASKLNLLVATEEQIRRLLEETVPEETNVDELVAAFLDWADQDDDERELGAENTYYQTLPVGYRCKNGPLETVEELLLIKGFTAAVVYGEDYNRNGLLDLNEDDGEQTFPLDDGDGTLRRGIYPYVTIHSRDRNAANDNQPRIFLNGEDVAKLEEDLLEYIDPAIVDYILAVRRSGKQIKNPASLLDASEEINGQPLVSPVTLADMPVLLDRTTGSPLTGMFGQINVNTAPAIVLRTITGLTNADVMAIVETRDSVSSIDKGTTAWLLMQGALAVETFKKVEPYLTARSLQYTIESIGFADHVGAFKRLQVIIEMRGQLGQVLYYRDLTQLGLGYPIRSDEEGMSSFARTNL